MSKTLALVIATAVYVLAGCGSAAAQFTDQLTWGGTSTGSANTQDITVANVGSYAQVQAVVFRFMAGYTNTGATTLNINGLGDMPVTLAGNALAGGEITTSVIQSVIWDGTDFELQPTVVGSGNLSCTFSGVAEYEPLVVDAATTGCMASNTIKATAHQNLTLDGGADSGSAAPGNVLINALAGASTRSGGGIDLVTGDDADSDSGANFALTGANRTSGAGGTAGFLLGNARNAGGDFAVATGADAAGDLGASATIYGGISGLGGGSVTFFPGQDAAGDMGAQATFTGGNSGGGGVDIEGGASGSSNAGGTLYAAGGASNSLGSAGTLSLDGGLPTAGGDSILSAGSAGSGGASLHLYNGPETGQGGIFAVIPGIAVSGDGGDMTIDLPAGDGGGNRQGLIIVTGQGLPTSDPGVTGALWKTGGVVHSD